MDDAEQIFSRLKHHAPLSVETRGFELELCLARSDRDEAKTLAGELVRQHPESARIRYLAGRVAYAERDYAGAARRFAESGKLFEHWRSKLWQAKALTQAGDFDQAEPMLLELSAAGKDVASELAWLFERRGDYAQALRSIDDHLGRHPDDQFALAQRLRLVSQTAGLETLEEEIETMEALDETIPPAMLPSYVEQLLTSARGDDARAFIAGHIESWDGTLAISIGWVCHRHFAADLALDLFLKALPDNTGQYKMLNAMEADARACRREAELIEAYARLLEREPRFHGRIRRLKKSSNR